MTRRTGSADLPLHGGRLKRLDDQSRTLERLAAGPSVAEVIAQERERSHLYGRRSVFGWEAPPAEPKKSA